MSQTEFPAAIKVKRRRVNTHGLSDIPEYRHWINMKTRCLDPTTPYFKNYGGRGIRVCERWLHSFEAFLADVGRRPGLGYSLDRFPDNNGHYEPGNVKWSTKSEQMRNVRTNSLVPLGEKMVTVTEAAEAIGLNPNTVIYRLRRGWTPQEALMPGNFQGKSRG